MFLRPLTGLKALLVGLLCLTLMLVPVLLIPDVAARVLIGAATLNADLTNLPPLPIENASQPTTLLDATGTPFGEYSNVDRTLVPLDQISTNVISALISAEDRTFYTNLGLDPRGILRAALANLTGSTRQGGSTITQQYAKNLLEIATGQPAAPTLERKLREITYARTLARTLTKAQILDGYLNLVYFGEGAYGIEAAAQRYFSTSAANLTIPEAAVLVALVESPSSYDPLANPALALKARNRVLAMMVTNHALPAPQATLYEATPLATNPSPLPPTGCAGTADPFFCQVVINQLLASPALGATLAARSAALDAGGLVVHTTLQPSYQTALSSASTSILSATNPVGTALVSIQPGTGRILSLAENRVYGLDVSHNQTEVNYALSPSPVGSTFKAFTLATALSQGLPTSTILPAGATYHSTLLKNPATGFYTNAEPYDPTYINFQSATAYSVNTAFVQLEEKVGVLNIARVARAMGLTDLPLTGPGAVSATEGSLTLGARSFSPLEMASAYATIASGGEYCQPTALTEVTTISGFTTHIPPVCHRALPQAVANTEAQLLRAVVEYGTGTAANIPGLAISGKTGTTQNFGSAWFIGFTPALVTASWVGNPLGPSHPLINVGGVYQVYGGTLPAEMFHQAFAAEAASPLTPSSLNAPALAMPNVIGLPLSVATARLGALGILSNVLGTTSTTKPTSATDPVVTWSSVAAGSPLSRGETVSLEVAR